jgi:hypothetical protein
VSRPDELQLSSNGFVARLSEATSACWIFLLISDAVLPIFGVSAFTVSADLTYAVGYRQQASGQLNTVGSEALFQ